MGTKPPSPESKPLSYERYLNVPDLLALQECRSSPPQHDELQFIIVHQCYELWFKLILHELHTVREALLSGRVRRGTKGLSRVNRIWALLVTQVHILETMDPVDFLAFRDALQPASGFQSVQFREIEFLAGARDPQLLRIYDNDPQARDRLARRLSEPSLWDGFIQVLQERDLLDTGRGGEIPNESLLRAIGRIYAEEDLGELHDLAEALIELDEEVRLWRYHHLAMVERVIGGKPGTGAHVVREVLKDEVMGSRGAAYLESTLSKRFFPLLWDARTLLTPGGHPGPSNIPRGTPAAPSY